jgi:hypothetical protein
MIVVYVPVATRSASRFMQGRRDHRATRREAGNSGTKLASAESKS